tara:strand:- start:46 stop:537 length:492 start_codon:yes stop_codon:yes gene_type:complete
MRYFFIIIVLIIITIDLASKYYIEQNIPLGQVIVVNEFLMINKIYNKGIIFGIAHSENIYINMLLIIILTLILLTLIYFFIQNIGKEGKLSRIHFISWASLFGGGFSNYIDRILDNKVTDFIVLYYDLFFFPGIFNLADIFITIAFIGFITEMMRSNDKKSSI